jgi:hypothetical protein
MGIEKIPKEEPGRDAKFQQEEKGHRGHVLPFRTNRPVGKQEDKGGKSKVIDKSPDKGSCHFWIVRFQVPQVFYENGADNDVANIQNDKQLLEAFGVTFVEKQPDKKKRGIQDEQIDG